MRGGIEIKRLDVWALFKLGFAVYAIIGLVVALFYAAIVLLAGALGTAWVPDEELPSLGLGIAGGLVGVIVIPVLAFFYGAIAGTFIAIGGLVYNVTARVVGGLRFDYESFGPAPGAVVPGQAADAATVVTRGEYAGTDVGDDAGTRAPGPAAPPDRTE